MLNQFVWVIYPYLCLAIFVIGHIARYKYDQFSWTAKSSEMIEKKRLKWGSLLFSFRYYSGILWSCCGIIDSR